MDNNTNNWLNRTEMLIGKEKMEKLQKANVIVFGLGGVGSYVVEGLVRAGIGNLTIVDKDVVDITNINRQLIADTTTIGKPKVEAEKERALKINPSLNITTIQEFVNADNIDEIIPYSIDYVIDAIDTVSSKLAIIKYCYAHSIPLISCMGTGNKLDASKFEITDITKTSVCPLAKVIRKELKKLGIPHLKVLYSKEEPIKATVADIESPFQSTKDSKTTSTSPASISFVPSVAGLLIAGEVVKELGAF